jgi:hypothetical protein
LAWYGAPLIVAVVGGSIVVGAISTSRAPRFQTRIAEDA